MQSWPESPVRWFDHRTDTGICYLVKFVDEYDMFSLQGNFLAIINTNKYLDMFHYGWYQWSAGSTAGMISTGGYHQNH
jgi:hypothetical protein